MSNDSAVPVDMNLETEWIARIDAELEQLQPHLAPLLARQNYLEELKAKLTGPSPKRRPTAAPAAIGVARTRPRTPGNRQSQLLEIVREHPQGITMTAAANKINERWPTDKPVEATYLYKCRKELEKTGKLRKEGALSFLAGEESLIPSPTRVAELEAARRTG